MSDLRTDIVAIESPEQIQIEYRIASPFSRLLAFSLDFIIMYGSLAIIVFLLYLLNIIDKLSSAKTFQDLFNPSLTESLTLFFILILDFVMQWGYFIFFELFMNGKTPGKSVLGLRVIHYSGKPLDAASIILRNFMRVFDQQMSLYLGAFFSIIFNKEFRRIGDLVAETIVINEDKRVFKFPDFSVVNIKLKDGQKILSKKLSEEELYVIRNFLNSLPALSKEKQKNLSDQLALKIKNRLQDDENYKDSLEYLREIYESHKD